MAGVQRDPSILGAARKSYIERDERPTLEELASEFSLPHGTLCRAAADEGWVIKRAEFLEKKAKEGDAYALLLQAASYDQKAQRAVADAGLSVLQSLSVTISQIPEGHAVSSRTNILNTASFCIKNIGDAFKAVGIVSMSKGIKTSGKGQDGEESIDPAKILSQLNININTQIAAAQTEGKKEKAAEVPVETRAVSEAEKPEGAK